MIMNTVQVEGLEALLLRIGSQSAKLTYDVSIKAVSEKGKQKRLNAATENRTCYSHHH